MTPNSISNLAWWVRPESVGLDSGSELNRIQNMVGNDSWIANLTNKPTWNPSASITNEGGILFGDITRQKIDSDTISNLKFLHNGSDSTVFIVFKLSEINKDGVFLDTNDITSANVGRSFLIRTDNTLQDFMTKGTGLSIINTRTTSSIADTGSVQYATFVYEFGAVGDDAIIRVNGIQAATFETQNTPHSTADPVAGAIGGRSITDTSTWRLNGTIFEIIMYDRRLSDTEISDVEDYIKKTFTIGGTPTTNPESISNIHDRLRFNKLGRNTLINNTDITDWNNDGSVGGIFKKSAPFQDSPKYLTNQSPSGMAGISFFGTNGSYFIHDGSTDLYKFLHNSTGNTIFIVTKRDRTDTEEVLIDNYNFSSLAIGRSLSFKIDNTFLNQCRRGSIPVPVYKYSSPGTYDTSSVIIVSSKYEFGATGDDSNLRIDRTNVASQETSGSPSPSASSANMAIGARSNDAIWFSGSIFEIVAYDRTLTDTEITGIEDYLYNKYILSGSQVSTSGSSVNTLTHAGVGGFFKRGDDEPKGIDFPVELLDISTAKSRKSSKIDYQKWVSDLSIYFTSHSFNIGSAIFITNSYIINVSGGHDLVYGNRLKTFNKFPLQSSLEKIFSENNFSQFCLSCQIDLLYNGVLGFWSGARLTGENLPEGSGEFIDNYVIPGIKPTLLFDHSVLNPGLLALDLVQFFKVNLSSIKGILTVKNDNNLYSFTWKGFG